MSYFTEASSVETVNGRMGADTDPRLKQVMSSLVQHLHAFIKDVGLTQEEWEYGIGFLTRTGQICSGERQEFILLSDTLGVSMLVDAINNRRPAGATENTDWETVAASTSSIAATIRLACRIRPSTATSAMPMAACSKAE